MQYVYGALLLHKLGHSVTEANLKKVVSAAGNEVDEAQIKTLVASLEGVDIAKELESASLMAAAPAAPSGSAEADKAEEKKEEKAAEAADSLASLFG